MIKQSVLAAALFTSVNAFSATQVWSFDESTTPIISNEVKMSVGDLDLTVTGWSEIGGVNGIERADLNWAYKDAPNADNRFNGADSLGIYNSQESSSSSYGHSVDSRESDFDMILLSFNEAVNLSGMALSWAKDYGNNWADVSVVGYTGNSNLGSDPFSGANEWADILSNDWSSIDNYGNVDDYNYQAVNTNLQSKYWLIGAYNSAFGYTSGQGLGDGNDGFKLAGLTTNYTTPPNVEVSAPGSLALLAAGLFGMGAMRRRTAN